eukprot:Em0019g966a
MGPWFILITFGLCAHEVASANVSCRDTIVVIGSTGDLARRYVWPAIFDNFVLRQNGFAKCALLTFGTYRSTKHAGEFNFSSLNSQLICPLGVDGELCDRAKRAFEDHVRFLPFNSEDDFRSLIRELERLYAEENVSELGRLFYLAIPPSAYSSVCRNIDTHARPTKGWLRVVLEKPFGRDQGSAEELAQKVAEYLEEDEVYRIDHYLGKTGVQQIVPFRENNDGSPSLPPWNARSVQRIEVVMKERLDVKGRTQFFDEYGILRDVHQNHLTEILARLLSDPAAGSFARQKVSILSKLYPPGPGQAVVGQYSTYQQHLVEDGVVSALSNASRTPTFASVVLYSRDARWSGVPFVLTAGKSLNERTSYAKVMFKNNFFSVANTTSTSTCLPEIVFMIQDEILRKPGVLLSWHFDHVHLNPPFPGWQVETVRHPTNGSCVYSFISPSIVPTANPYGALIGAVLDGNRGQFVDTQSLLESWSIWTPLLQNLGLSSTRPHLYSLDSLHSLDFSLGPDGVHLLNLANSMYHVNFPQANGQQLDALPGIFASSSIDQGNLSVLFGIPTYSGNRFEIADSLAAHIYMAARDAVARGGHFHLALPGGQSPLTLYQTLVLRYRDVFPWEQTHVWLTDERCVGLDGEDSNILHLSAHLLTLLPIPYHQVHPFPTELQHGLCSEEDNGTWLHERRLNSTTGTGVLDYVVLGVGIDGHVASLFPGASQMWNGLVELVEVQGVTGVRRRMTLTHKALQLARHVSLLISGSHQEKHGVFTALKTCFGSHLTGCGLPAYDVILSRRSSPTSLYIDALLL